MTFDAWEVAVHPPEDYLMHFRTKGSKNGVRRYQNEDGTWTEVGLAERRKREGFGESRKERKAAKRMARTERHMARRQARAEARAAYAEKQRQKSLKGLTDEELRNKISRLKMEQEYKELNKSPLIKTGAELVTKILEYKNNKEQRAFEINKQEIDRMRAEADIIRAKTSVKRAQEETKKAEAESKTAKEKRMQAQTERKQNLINAKKEYANYTIRGGVAKRINMALTSGKAKQYEAERKAKGDAKANEIKSKNDAAYNQYRSDAARDLKNRQSKQSYDDTLRNKKREKKLNKKLGKIG